MHPHPTHIPTSISIFFSVFFSPSLNLCLSQSLPLSLFLCAYLLVYPYDLYSISACLSSLPLTIFCFFFSPLSVSLSFALFWFFLSITLSLCLFPSFCQTESPAAVYCCYSATKLCSVLCDSWTTACQVPLSFTISRSLLRFTSLELVVLSNPSIGPWVGSSPWYWWEQ